MIQRIYAGCFLAMVLFCMAGIVIGKERAVIMLCEVCIGWVVTRILSEAVEAFKPQRSSTQKKHRIGE